MSALGPAACRLIVITLSNGDPTVVSKPLDNRLTKEPAGPADWKAQLNVLKSDLKLTDDAIGLLAIQLKFRVQDIQAVAAESLTGGGDDKKCDVLFVDKELQVAVIAQCYFAKSSKQAAPSNKAQDLNTAIGWLLTRDIDELPQTLKGRADELREAIKAGNIKQLYVWYVHNLPSSRNVENELKTVEQTARKALQSYQNSSEINVFAEEIGNEAIARLYRQVARAIIVTDSFSTSVSDAMTVTGEGWSAILTTVRGSWLTSLYEKYRSDLFSANLRGYLGSRSTDSNINNGIKILRRMSQKTSGSTTMELRL